MRQISRVIVAIFAVAALTGGGTVAFADHGPGGSSGSGSGEEHGGHHEAGDDNARHDAGDDHGAKPEAGDDRGDNAGPGKVDDNRTADVYTLAEPQHGNPEGVAFDKRSGFFFVSATGDGSIYRGKLGDTATPVPVFIPGAAGQSATGLKVQHGKLYAAGAAHGDDQGLRRRQRRAAGDVRHQGRRQLADLRQRPRRHQARRRLRDRLQAPRDLPPDGGGDRRRHAGAQADRPRPTSSRRRPRSPSTPRRRRSTSTASSSTTTAATTRAATTATVTATTAIGAPTSSSSSTRTPASSSASRWARTATPRARSASCRSTAARSRAATACSSTAASCSSCRARTPTTASPTASSTSSTCATAAASGRLADQRTDASFQGPSTIARARDRYLVVNPDFATSTPPFTVTALPR